MKAYVKRRLAEAGVIEGPVPSGPMKLSPTSSRLLSPTHVTDPFERQCLLQLNEGNTLSLREIEAILHLKKHKVRRMFAHLPGVFKIGRSYRVPRLVFDRAMSETMNCRQPHLD
jgi:hypothetical protein